MSRLSAFFLCLMVCFSLGFAHRVQAEARALAAEFDRHAAVALAAEGPSEDAYLAAALLNRILSEFPDSLEARLLNARGRLPNRTVDLAALRLLAAEWQAANPGLAPLAALESLPTQTATPAALAALPPALPAPLLPPRAEGGDLSQSPTSLSAQTAGAVRLGSDPSWQELARHTRRHAVLVAVLTGNVSGRFGAIHLGSGSFIGPDLVLTNAHVVDDVRDSVFLVINEHIGVRTAVVDSIAREDTPINIDAAVLRLQEFRVDSWLTFAADAELDQRILIGGYPGAAALNDARYRLLDEALAAARAPGADVLPTAVVNEGRINNFIASTVSRSIEPLYAMVTGPGNSGSAILDFCGNVVALHYYGGHSELDRGVKFNSGVHVRDLLTYLRTVGVPMSVAPEPCRDEG